MKKYLIISTLITLLAACSGSPTLQVESEGLEPGEKISLVTYTDSVTVGQGTVEGSSIILSPSSAAKGTLLQIMVGGKVRGYYVAEPGKAVWKYGNDVASGTKMNDLLTSTMARLDSIDNLDDLKLYDAAALEQYNLHRNNALAPLMLNEYMRFADLQPIDSLLQTVPAGIKDAKRFKKMRNSAVLRERTAPGHKFTDFTVSDANGGKVSLSDYAGKGKPVLVDFWASWCPYCIKEMPEIASLYADYKEKGLEIVGVAVRDEVADTKEAVGKHGITWPVMYDAQRIPYDIYGFAGIPHHMLIGPDGTILSRGENIAQIRKQISKLLP